MHLRQATPPNRCRIDRARVRYHPLVARTGTFLAFLLAGAVVTAFEPTLGPGTLAEAIEIGQTRMDSARARFHAPYHIDIKQPPVDYIEVVTPFRRVAIDSEAHTHAGARLYGQREALAVLGDDPTRIDIVVELTFHPMNTYIGVPDYGVRLERGDGSMVPLQPRTIRRLPRFGPRLSGLPLPYPYMTAPPARSGSQPLLGGSIVATFDGEMVGPRDTYLAVVSEAGKDLARGRVDLSAFR